MFTDTPNDFLLTRPDDVRAALFELTHPESHVLVRDATDREVAVLVLGADKQTGFFFWRPRDYAGANFAANGQQDALVGMVFHFIATGYGGVRIHFRVPRPQLIRFEDGSAAFMSAIPDRLSRIQRRKIFRAPLGAIRATGRCVIGSVPTEFSIRDISVEGIGLRFPMRIDALPKRGAILENVALDFGEWGMLNVAVEVRNVYAIGGQPVVKSGAVPGMASNDNARAGLTQEESGTTVCAPPADYNRNPESHIGATFINLSGRDEIWLQQVVWRLEKNRNAGGL